MTEARGRFIQAQKRMLDRHGIEAASHFIEVPSIEGQAHVLVTGEGPAVVMLNGIGTPAAMWAPLMAHLTGLRVYAVDLPAYGLTDSTRDFAVDLRGNAVRFLEQVLDGLELQAPAIVANSLGSLWAIWLALDRPDRVRSLVHVACPAALLDTSPPPPMRLLSARPLGRILTRLQPPSEKTVEDQAKMVNQHPLSPELADLLLATERLPRFHHAFLSTLNVVVRLRGYRPAMRLTAEQLARITQPTLVVWGRNDPFGSVEAGRRMVEVMPDAELKLVDGGHAPWLNQAGQIGAMTVSFLG